MVKAKAFRPLDAGGAGAARQPYPNPQIVVLAKAHFCR
jgi:hypothetical protein